MVSQLNWWDDKNKALELAVSLRGNAQSVLSDLSHEQRRNYHDLVTALASRFEPDNQSELYRLEMKHRQRKRGESLNELAQEVKRLTNKAYPAAPVVVREQLARDCFLDALNDPEMEWAVHQGKPKSMDDAAHLALEFESFRSGRKVKLGVRPHTIRMQDTEPGGTSFDTNSGPRVGEASEVGKLLKDISGRLNALEKTGARASSQHSNYQIDNNTRRLAHQRKGKCHYCRQEGHWKNECPLRNKKGASSVSRNDLNSHRGNNTADSTSYHCQGNVN
ncbi:hypothetical protein ACJMK2_028310 [Sinanodonta woodiana]|uniref:CCHC-type domain-containing protein n=1 Tax=Sinanodonta woodiana TaxID=1069815 RepID=A0ABD3X6Q0_SINWO